MFPSTFSIGAYVTLAFFLSTLETWLHKLRKLHAKQGLMTKRYRDLGPEGRLDAERARALLRPGETLELPHEENEFTWSAWTEMPYYQMQSSKEQDTYHKRKLAIALLEDVIASAKATEDALQARMKNARPIPDPYGHDSLVPNLKLLRPGTDETEGAKRIAPELEPTTVYLSELRQIIDLLRMLGVEMSELYAEEC